MLQKRKPLFLLAAIMLVICMAFDKWHYHGNGQTIIKTLDGSIGQLKQDSVVLIEDPIFFDNGLQGSLITPYQVQNMVSLEVNEDALAMVQSDFTASVRLQVKKTDASQQVTTSTVDLVLDYKRDGISAHRKTHIFNNAYRVEVKVISVDKGTATWDVFSVLKIVNQLQSYPEFNFHCTDNAVQSIFITGGTPPANTTLDELPVNWPGVIQANEYDLEWAYIDSAALASGRYGNSATPDPYLIFANNASRITITGTSYKIPLFYDKKGHLFFRVRSVHWSSALSPEGGRMEADWSSSFTGSGGLGKFDYEGHEQSINWQSTTSFAEDGKRKSVVQYYDGSLRSRQTVTKDNVSNSTIATESFYDYQGRPVIQVMPVPTLKNVIGYTRGLNRAPGKADYDKSLYDTLPDPNQYCGIQAVPMDTSIGDAMSTSRYYSPANDSVAIPRKEGRPVDPRFAYIPDAEQYPFTEVEYTQDNSGRINRQSGVGKTFRMGGGRETQYAYSTPDQKELDALFGTEVGDASHYQKSIVRDANGQFSVSYVDMRGRTIATALVGSLPTDTKLDALSSATLEPRMRNLSDPSSAILRDLVMESKNSIEVTRDNAVHEFVYTLSPESLELEGAGENPETFCYDCLYDLQITITSDCNNGKLPNGVAFDTLIRNFSLANIDTTCTPAQGFNVSFSLMLNKGTYDITKKLSVSQSSLDYYRDSLFMKRNRFRDLQSFIEEQRALINTGTGCKPECAGCLESLGTWSTFWTNYKTTNQIADADTSKYLNAAKTAYDDARNSCIELCGLGTDSLGMRQAMMADLTPPYGQYANPERYGSMYSIFNNTKTNYFRTVTNYKDENGNSALIYSPNAGKRLPPQELSDKEFIDNFQESWAEALLPQHPEYCLLQQHELLNQSHQWDRKIELIGSYEEAMQKGYLNPTGATIAPFSSYAGTTPLDNDPLATLAGGYFKSSLETAIGSNYRGTGLSLYSWAAISVMCDASSGLPCIQKYETATSVATSTELCAADRDLIWEAFRSMYLQAKRELINTWMRAQCPGAPTGKSLTDSNYVPHFALSTDLLQKEGFTIPNSSMSAESEKTKAETEAKKYYESNCKSYVEYWIKTLAASCANYDTADLRATVVPKLLKICTEGADMDHPQGSSSVAPTSTHAYKNFEEVIREYNQLRNIKNNNCNAYSIEVPRPYDQQLPNSRKPVIGKPSDCECEQINKYHNEYQKKINRYKSFSDFMWKRYATIVDDSTASFLVAVCNNATVDCSIKKGVVTLPTAFQCGTGEICIDCEQFGKLDAAFRSIHPEVLPSADSSLTDSTQKSWNKLYEQFMNYRLGYTKTTTEYLDFAAKCGISGSPGCDSLNRIFLEYQNTQKSDFAISYQVMAADGGEGPNFNRKFTDPTLIVKDGALQFPDHIKTRDYQWYHAYSAIPTKARTICASDGYSFEVRFRYLKSTLKRGDLLYISNGHNCTVGIERNLTSAQKGIYIHGFSGYGEESRFGALFGTTNGFTRILVDADTNALNNWVTVKTTVTPSNYRIYFNGALIITLPRNSTIPMPNLNNVGINMVGGYGAVDWFRISDHNGKVKYFEDFTDLSGYTIPADSTFCPSVNDCKPAFTEFFNLKNNSSLTYEQIEALYYRTCGRSPDPCGNNVDTILNIVDRFNRNYNPTRIMPVLESPNLPAPNNIITDPQKVMRDGIFQYPAALQTPDVSTKPYYTLYTAPGTELCMSPGFSMEAKAKFISNPNGSQLAHIFTFEIPDNVAAKLLKGFPTAGIYLSDVYMWGPNGWTNYLPAQVKIMDDYNTFFNQWNTFKLSIDNDSIRFYCNGVRIHAMRNLRGYVTNQNRLGFSAGGYLAQYDWIKVQDHDENTVLFEDFNNPDKLARFDPSFICASASPCQTAFVNYYNQQRGTNYSYVQIDSIYHFYTGRNLDVCAGMNKADTILNIVDRFNKNYDPGRIIPYLSSTSLAAPNNLIEDPNRIIRDGIFQYPASLQTNDLTSKPYYMIRTDPGTELCLSEGFSVETKAKFIRNPNGSDLAHIFTFEFIDNVAAKLLKGFPTAGIYLSDVWLQGTDGNWANRLSTPVKVFDNYNTFFNQWNTYKVSINKDSIKFYCNGVKLMAMRNLKGIVVPNKPFGFSAGGYLAQYDWIRVRDKNENTMMFEDFNDPDKLSRFNPSFLCATAAPCQTAFVNYYNAQQGTNYSYVQIDSLYHHLTGRSLDVCGAMDSLVMMKKRYNSNANPHRVSVFHFMNENSLSHLPFYYNTNKESSFDDGIFRWPDYARDPELYNTWWRYSNLGFAANICAGNGYTIEGGVRALKDNLRTSEENFSINVGGNFSAVLYKRSEPGTPRHGFSLSRINIRKPVGSNFETYNVLPTGVIHNIDSSTAFLSKQWHTFKIQVTQSNVALYWNGNLVGQGDIPQNQGYSIPTNFNGIQIGFMGMHGAIDWLKLFNDKNELILHEDYDDPYERHLINPDFLCPKPTVDCSTAFRNYFNQSKGTNYTVAKLDSIYKAMTGTGINFCDFSVQDEKMLCGRATSAFPVIFEDELTSCSDSTFFIESKAQTFYQNYIDSLRGTFDSLYKAKCLQAYKFENFTVRDTASEYHYTLYYYDQAGNLVKTIPPSGVRPNRDPAWLQNVRAARANGVSLTPDHELPTNYRYNALNQVVAQQSPDGGLSKFWYDRLGRLVISQNAKQKYAATTEENRLYSYTKYDDLGRIKEVGQVKNLASNNAMSDIISRSQASLDNWLTALSQRREQITATVYDLPYPGFEEVVDNSQLIRQRNLRNRVSYTTYTDGWNIANYNQGTFYTYDIHGNVDTLLQDYGCGSCSAAEVFNLMNQNGNRFKKISYNYDLISGKVNSVAYQKGWSDQFFHRYSYDGENRLTVVETSLDGFNWEKDARYEYYLHGPLARTVLGNQQVQGIDYAYTLQGWLKGINSAGAKDSFDIGGDGRITSSNRYVARDAFGFALNYYGNDYKGIDTFTNPFPGYSAHLNTDFRPLYNGNISSMVSTNRIFENPAAHPDSAALLFNYRYDQLNRITGMDVFNKFNRTTNSYADLTKLEQFKERVSYDGNGNILKYLRNGNDQAHFRMDSLAYSYYPGTNRLRRVRDSVPSNWYGANLTDKIIDIDDQADADNYIYDSIGNLIRDKAEKINNINWNVYGKITGISRGAGIQVPASEIRYTYDAAGNRISKSVEKNGQKTITWYVRDAQGNVMATYTGEASAATALTGFDLSENERYIYGSSRLGVVTAIQPVDNGNAGPAAVIDTGGLFVRGERMYELSNHLGNVLVTVSDRKKAVADPLNAALIKFFEPVMLSGTDYYPFGMAMRVGGDNKYRYGFNGKENDNEVKGGDGLQQDYALRIYDTRIGKFLSVDPLAREYPWNSPYAFAENDVIRSIDLEGAEKHVRTFAYAISNGNTVQAVISNDYVPPPEGQFNVAHWFGLAETNEEEVARAMVKAMGVPKDGIFNFFVFAPELGKKDYARYDYTDIGGKQQAWYVSSEDIEKYYNHFSNERQQAGVILKTAGAALSVMGAAGKLLGAELKAASAELNAASKELNTTFTTPGIPSTPKGVNNANTKAAVNLGNKVHYDALNGGTGVGLPTELSLKYPNTQFSFTPRGAKGADVKVIGGTHPSQYPNSTWLPTNMHGDFKPGTKSGQSTFKSDIKSGKLPTDTQILTYDPQTGKLQ